MFRQKWLSLKIRLSVSRHFVFMQIIPTFVLTCHPLVDFSDVGVKMFRKTVALLQNKF